MTSETAAILTALALIMLYEVWLRAKVWLEAFALDALDKVDEKFGVSGFKTDPELCEGATREHERLAWYPIRFKGKWFFAVRVVIKDQLVSYCGEKFWLRVEVRLKDVNV